MITEKEYLEAKKIAETYESEQLNERADGGSFPSEIHVTYDRSDGEIFCAFIDKEQCKQEAEESGCGMQTVRLIGKQ